MYLGAGGIIYMSRRIHIHEVEGERAEGMEGEAEGRKNRLALIWISTLEVSNGYCWSWLVVVLGTRER